MGVGRRKVIALSNLVDRLRVEQDRECKNSSFVKGVPFCFVLRLKYLNIGGDVWTYNKILYE